MTRSAPYESTYEETNVVKTIASRVLRALHRLIRADVLYNTCPALADARKKRSVAVQTAIRVSVSAEGRVTNTDLVSSSGFDDLDATLVDAYRKCQYSPAVKDGKPVADVLTFVVRSKPD